MCLLLILTCLIVVYSTAASNAEQPPQNSSPFKVGVETTFVVGPLRSDGFPDYARSFDRKVDPQVNAVVAFWQLFGPSKIATEIRQDYFKRLGTPIPAESGAYFSILDMRSDQELSEEFQIASDRPWGSKDCPRLAAWFDANQAGIRKVVEILNQKEYFDPIIAPTSLTAVESTQLPIRAICDMLHMNALRQIARGDDELAAGNIVALLQYARFLRNSPEPTTMILGNVSGAFALHAQNAFMNSSKLRRASVASFATRLLKLEEPKPRQNEMLRWDRLMWLDLVYFTWRKLRNTPAESAVDWNRVLEIGNDYFNRFEEAATPQQRNTLYADIDKQRAQVSKNVTPLVESLNLKQKGIKSEMDFYIAVLPHIAQPEEVIVADLMRLFPDQKSPLHGSETDSRATAYFRLTVLAALVRREQLASGAIPSSFDRIDFGRRKELSLDPYSNSVFRIKQNRDSTEVYAIGANGIDDGGDTQNVPSRDDRPSIVLMKFK